MLTDSVAISFTLNGAATSIDVNCTHTLAKVLREQLGLIGTKVSCEQGECGACTVIVDGKAVNSCIMLAAEPSKDSRKTANSIPFRPRSSKRARCSADTVRPA